VFRNDPQGAPGNAETSARKYAAKLELRNKNDQYGFMRSRAMVRALD